jgi:hypothetical protein
VVGSICDRNAAIARRVAVDFAVVQQFMHRVRTVCAELHAEPFNTGARAELLALLVDAAPYVDDAALRLGDDMGWT